MLQDILDIPIDEIVISEKLSKDRYDQNSICGLSLAIKQEGLLNPITVVKVGDNRYRVVCGRRRYLACRHANFKTIKATVISDGENVEFLTVIDNIQRKDLSPIEEAEAYGELLRTKQISQSVLAKRMGKSQIYVSQKLRLLKLPDSVHILMRSKLLSEGHARQLLRLEDIIGNLVTTDFRESSYRPSEQERFKNWTEYYQDFFAWEYFSSTVQVLTERIDKFYFDLLISALDDFEFLDLAQKVIKERFNPKVKRREDAGFIGYYSNKYCTPAKVYNDEELEMLGYIGKETEDVEDVEEPNE